MAEWKFYEDYKGFKIYVKLVNNNPDQIRLAAVKIVDRYYLEKDVDSARKSINASIYDDIDKALTGEN